jgi:hypothetical protein
VIAYLFGYAGATAMCPFVTILAFYRIATQGYARFIEPNPIILTVEVVATIYTIAFMIYQNHKFAKAVANKGEF